MASTRTCSRNAFQGELPPLDINAANGIVSATARERSPNESSSENLSSSSDGCIGLGSGSAARKWLGAPEVGPRGYEMHDLIGQGTYALVYLAESTTSMHQNLVAVKAISRERSKPEQVKMEVAALKKCNHANIQHYIEFQEDSSWYYLVTEYGNGGELFDHILANGVFTETDAIDVMRQLFDGVAYLHSVGIVHRDLKPENVLLKSSPGDRDLHLMLADFGLAKVVEPSGDQHLRAKTYLGSVLYMAPEVTPSEDGYTEKVDVWSLGIIMYILLCGQPPFEDPDDNPALIAAQVKKGLQDDVHFDSEDWGGISNEAKVLIKQLLRVSPMRRISAREAVVHDWTQGRGEPQDNFSSPGTLEEFGEQFMPTYSEYSPAREGVSKSRIAKEFAERDETGPTSWGGRRRCLQEGEWLTPRTMSWDEDFLDDQTSENLDGSSINENKIRDGPSINENKIRDGSSINENKIRDGSSIKENPLTKSSAHIPSTAEKDFLVTRVPVREAFQDQNHHTDCDGESRTVVPANSAIPEASYANADRERELPLGSRYLATIGENQINSNLQGPATPRASRSARLDVYTPLPAPPPSPAVWLPMHSPGVQASVVSSSFRIGSHYEGENYSGTILYVGHLQGKAGLWVGMSLDPAFAHLGNTDGMFQNRRYFQTPGYTKSGKFVLFEEALEDHKAPAPPSAASVRTFGYSPKTELSVSLRFSSKSPTGSDAGAPEDDFCDAEDFLDRNSTEFSADMELRVDLASGAERTVAPPTPPKRTGSPLNASPRVPKARPHIASRPQEAPHRRSASPNMYNIREKRRLSANYMRNLQEFTRKCYIQRANMTPRSRTPGPLLAASESFFSSPAKGKSAHSGGVQVQPKSCTNSNSRNNISNRQRDHRNCELNTSNSSWASGSVALSNETGSGAFEANAVRDGLLDQRGQQTSMIGQRGGNGESWVHGENIHDQDAPRRLSREQRFLPVPLPSIPSQETDQENMYQPAPPHLKQHRPQGTCPPVSLPQSRHHLENSHLPSPSQYSKGELDHENSHLPAPPRKLNRQLNDGNSHLPAPPRQLSRQLTDGNSHLPTPPRQLNKDANQENDFVPTSVPSKELKNGHLPHSLQGTSHGKDTPRPNIPHGLSASSTTSQCNGFVSCSQEQWNPSRYEDGLVASLEPVHLDHSTTKMYGRSDSWASLEWHTDETIFPVNTGVNRDPFYIRQRDSANKKTLITNSIAARRTNAKTTKSPLDEISNTLNLATLEPQEEREPNRRRTT